MDGKKKFGTYLEVFSSMGQFYNFSGANYVYSNSDVETFIEPNRGSTVKYYVHLFD